MRNTSPGFAALLASLVNGVFFSVAPTFATNYYLGPQGKDGNSGSLNSPWPTLALAHGRMAPGDTLFVRGGAYSNAYINWTKSGTADRPMVLKAYPGEKPVFTGSGTNYFIQSTGRYLVFDGLEITGYIRSAFNPIGGGHLTIRNCDMHHILAQDYGAITPQYCDNVLIENNVFREIGRTLEQTFFDHAVYNAAGSHDIIIRNNLFLDNYGGPAINHYHTPSPYNILIYNNVFRMTKGAERSGIFTGDGTHDVQVFNNTFYIDGKGAVKAYGVTFNSGQGTNEAVNNIFYVVNWDVANSIVSPGGVKDLTDHNLYFPAKDVDDLGPRSRAGDPLFLNTLAFDFHLRPGSPAINSGRAIDAIRFDIEGKARPVGTGFDIGAYEFAETSTHSGSATHSERSSSSSLRATRTYQGSRYLFRHVQGNPAGIVPPVSETFDAMGVLAR